MDRRKPTRVFSSSAFTTPQNRRNYTSTPLSQEIKSTGDKNSSNKMVSISSSPRKGYSIPTAGMHGKHCCASKSMAATLRDPNSVANIQDFQTKHIHLDWKVDFENSKIVGSATLDLIKMEGGQECLKLDCSHLVIHRVTLFGKEQSQVNLVFKIDTKANKFGGLLLIDLPTDVQPTFKVKIEYETSEQCSALQWLTPEQTLGKKYPYLFSQCQAIHARSMLPCQDTPAIKSTFSARVTAPNPISVVMSANRRQVNAKSSVTTPSIAAVAEGVFEFEQTQPIPSYLIAIGAGDIYSKELGPRSAVWCEKEVLEEAAWEFAETETFIKTAEDLAGPYVWERYDILLLPPSFPYGGMENPCLTFLTPSLLAGDRSLVDVVAHEISHSWTGNLVSCVNWEHFWLNEGFTMFLERKILGRLQGEEHRQFDSQLGLAELRESVADFNEDYRTALVPDLRETDPDDVFSRVPYEKGYTLLYTLEDLVGGPAIFEPFLKAHIQNFAGASIDTNQFHESILSYYSDDAQIAAKLNSFDWKTWFYGLGMPPTVPEYSQTLMKPCLELAKQWMTAPDSVNDHEFAEMKPAQRAMFFDILMQHASSIAPSTVLAIGDRYKMATVQHNVEIMLNWHLLCIRNRAEKYYEDAAHFASLHGRMKYCRPILKELFKSGPMGRELAIATFEKNFRFYHPIASTMISKDLNLH